jgi:hypothetical protein
MTVGGCIDSAFFRLETLEQAARIMHHAAVLGGACSLDRAALEKLKRRPPGVD